MELPQRKPILSALVGDDAHIVPKPCGQIAEKYIRNVSEIKKYVIMPGHIHMIIRLHNLNYLALSKGVASAAPFVCW